MKIDGAELAEFERTAWPGDSWYWDHDLFEIPEPGKQYDTDDIGCLYWQGEGEDPTGGDGLDLAKLIRRWRKVRDCDLITAWVPKSRIPEAAEFLKSLSK